MSVVDKTKRMKVEKTTCHNMKRHGRGEKWDNHASGETLCNGGAMAPSSFLGRIENGMLEFEADADAVVCIHMTAPDMFSLEL
ncbi:hypothetical protein AKJ16_DCAP25764 [Drosera capensis]